MDWWKLKRGQTPSEEESNLSITSIPSTHLQEVTHQSKAQSMDNVESWFRSSTVFCDSFAGSCWSGTGVSKENGCLLLAITTTHRVPIFEPVADPFKGEWQEIYDLSNDIKPFYSESKDGLKKLDKLESISCAWSDRLLIQKTSRFSIIAIGSKYGIVTLHSFNAEPKSILSIPVFEDVWATKLAWSQWVTSTTGPYSLLAVAGSNGVVRVYKVVLNENNKSVESQLVASLFEGNRAMVSVLKFYDIKNDASMKLAIGKAGCVAVWSCSTSESSIQDLTTISLSNTLSIAGLVWGIKGEELRVYSSSGGLIVLSVTTSDGTLKLDLVLDESKEFLEEVLEIQNSQDSNLEKDSDGGDGDEDEEVESDDRKIVVYGASGSPNNLFDTLVYATYNANDMTYKVLSHERCKVLIRPAYEADDTEIMNDILIRFNGLVPWYLSHGKRLNSNMLWDVIKRFGSSHFNEDMPFMNRFRMELNLRDSVESQEMVVVDSVDALYHEMYQDADVQVSTLVSYSLLSQPDLREDKVHGLQMLYFSRILELMQENSKDLQDSDILTIFLITDCFVQNQTAWSPLRNQVKQILVTLNAPLFSKNMQESAKSQMMVMESRTSGLPEAREKCPACQEAIRFESILDANCPNGHHWTRCSMSLCIIATPTFRSCSGCHVQCRVTEENDSSLISKVLKKMDACFLCGCSFQKSGFEFPA